MRMKTYNRRRDGRNSDDHEDVVLLLVAAIATLVALLNVFIPTAGFAW